MPFGIPDILVIPGLSGTWPRTYWTHCRRNSLFSPGVLLSFGLFFPLVAGIFLRSSVSSNILRITGILIIFVILVIAVCIIPAAKTRFSLKTLIQCWIVICSILFFQEVSLQYQTASFGIPSGTVTGFSGKAAADSQLFGSRFCTEIQLEQVRDIHGNRVSARGVLVVYSDDGPFSAGEICTGAGSLLWNPEDLHYTVFAETMVPDGWSSRVWAVREDMVEAICRKGSRLGDKAGELFLSLFLGKCDNPDAPLFYAFRKAGASHILALSGFHVGILISLLSFVLKPVFPQKTVQVISVGMLGFYLFLTGLRPSLVRAVVFFLAGCIASLLNRKSPLRFRLLLTGIILLSVFPDFLSSLAFQLSYCALLGIITLGTDLGLKLQRIIPPFLARSVSASVSAMLFTAPIVLTAFGRMYPGGIISSLVITPLITLFLPASLLAIIIPEYPGILIRGFSEYTELIFRLLRFLARIPPWVPKEGGEGLSLFVFCAACSMYLLFRGYHFFRRNVMMKFLHDQLQF